MKFHLLRFLGAPSLTGTHSTISNNLSSNHTVKKSPRQWDLKLSNTEGAIQQGCTHHCLVGRQICVLFWLTITAADSLLPECRNGCCNLTTLIPYLCFPSSIQNYFFLIWTNLNPLVSFCSRIRPTSNRLQYLSLLLSDLSLPWCHFVLDCWACMFSADW